MSNGLFYLQVNSVLDVHSFIRGAWLVFIIVMFVETSNCADPDQTPRYAVSYLGLRCLPIPISLNATHKWVNYFRSSSRKNILDFINNEVEPGRSIS